MGSVIDMSGFRNDAIDFDDLEGFSLEKLVVILVFDVEPSVVEALHGFAYSIHEGIEFLVY